MNSIDCALLLGNKRLILIQNNNSSRSLAVLTTNFVTLRKRSEEDQVAITLW